MKQIKIRATILISVWIAVIFVTALLCTNNFRNGLDLVSTLGLAILIYSSVPILVLYIIILLSREGKERRAEKMYTAILVISIISFLGTLGLISEQIKYYLGII